MYEEEHYSSIIKYMLRLCVHGGRRLQSIYNLVALVVYQIRTRFRPRIYNIYNSQELHQLLQQRQGCKRHVF